MNSVAIVTGASRDRSIHRDSTGVRFFGDLASCTKRECTERGAAAVSEEDAAGFLGVPG